MTKRIFFPLLLLKDLMLFLVMNAYRELFFDLVNEVHTRRVRELWLYLIPANTKMYLLLGLKTWVENDRIQI